jgi:DMSO/TMAO reductase YedYZ molybdopterin-dependent catalytic subunit
MADDGNREGKFKDRLIATKEAWARDRRLLTGKAGDPERDRLPPGQREVKNWPVLDLGVQPDIPLDKWFLTIDGLVENPVRWHWDEFRAQPEFQATSDIHCVTAWSRYDNHWAGVSAKHIIGTVKPKPEAKFVIFHSFDTYTTNVPLAAFDDGDVLLAHSWEGKPIPREHGGPLRVVIPKLYFWKSAKWLKRIEFAAEDRPGFWEVRGYHNNGDPWTEERYG